MARESKPLDEKPGTLAVSTLEALLNAEARFLSRLRDIAATQYRSNKGLEQLQRDLNHDNIIHICRFFFLLSALNCTTPEAISTFIDSHNEKVLSLLRSENFQIRSKNELKKAIFSHKRKYMIVETIREKMRPTFAKSEIADFLFDHMARDSSFKGIDNLLYAGLLIEQEDNLLEGSNRILISTDGQLERIFSDYLDDVRSFISGST